MDKPKCLYAFRALSVSKNGDLNPCPSYKGSVGSIFSTPDLTRFFNEDPRLNELRTAELENKWHLPGCQFCADNPEASAKTTFNQNMAYLFPHYTSARTQLNHLEIDFGNHCNLDCVMCSSEYSTKWHQDDLEYNKTREGGIRRPQGKPWRLKSEHVHQLLELCEHVESVHVKGGEPLLEKNFELFLDGLCRREKQNIALAVVTNFTLMNDRLLALFEKFKEPVINVSIDGKDAVYNWIRGFDFQKLESKLVHYMSRLPQADFIFNFTASAYNIHQIEDFYAWANDLKKKTGAQLSIQYGPVVKYPRYLVPFLSGHREQALRQIDRVIQDPLSFSKAPVFRASLEALRENLRLTPPDLESRLQEFRAWHHFLIKKRGWDLAKEVDLGHSF